MDQLRMSWAGSSYEMIIDKLEMLESSRNDMKDKEGNKEALIDWLITNDEETLIEGVKSNPNGASTTACLAKLESGKMKTCNLGDSGYLLLRSSSNGSLEKVFRSTSQ